MTASNILSLPFIRIGKYTFSGFFKDFVAKLTLLFAEFGMAFWPENAFWTDIEI